MEEKIERSVQEHFILEGPFIQKDSSAAISQERQKTLFSIWLAEIRKEKRKRFKIPNKFLNLPCGCSRNRNSERDPETIWHIKKINGKFIHSECKKACPII